MELDERKRKILRAVINAYIETGEPIGSKALLSRENLNVSSATIRNEMSELEQLGFLCKPHTSAGRIPSNEGYRFYVTTALDNYNLSKEEKDILSPAIDNSASIKEIVDLMANSIALFSGCTVFALSPLCSDGCFTFEIAPVGKQGIAIMAISSGNTVKTCFSKIAHNVNAEDCRKLSKIFNDILSGFSVEHIGNVRLLLLEHEIRTHLPNYLPICVSVGKLVEQLKQYDLHISGTSNLLLYPEFANIEAARDFLNLLNRREDIISALLDDFYKDNITIKIGDENNIFNSPHASMIAIGADGKVPMILGVMGPTRMYYSRIIAGCNHILNYLKNNITE